MEYKELTPRQENECRLIIIGFLFLFLAIPLGIVTLVIVFNLPSKKSPCESWGMNWINNKIESII